MARNDCAIKSPVDRVSVQSGRRASRIAVMLRSFLLWVCSACWPNSLKEDASPVAPCGQTEHTRPLWHSCVPVAWGESFSCSTVSRESSATSTPNCWETGTCSVLLYCESESTAHFNLHEFHQERMGRNKKGAICGRYYFGKITISFVTPDYKRFSISPFRFWGYFPLRCITNLLATTVGSIIL